MKHKLTYILIGACCLAPLALAASSNSTSTKVKNRFYCPAIKDIKKDPNKMTWFADRDNYKSYDMSFATAIDKFIGAQWVGANVGQITCVYATKPKTAFPVMLIFYTLTHQPAGGKWSKNLGGYLNCGALDQKDCPFKMVLKKQPTDIYQEAEKLKPKE